MGGGALFLLLSASCTNDKPTFGSSSPGDDTGTDGGTVDTGTPDTGGTGDTGGTEGEDHPPGEVVSCATLATVTGSHFGEVQSSAPDAPPGTECRCQVAFTGFEEDTDTVQIRVTGTATDTDGDGIADGGAVPDEVYVVAPLWDVGSFGQTAYSGGPSWYDQVLAHSLPAGYDATDLNGTWALYLTESTRAGAGEDQTYVDACADYTDVTFMVDYPSRVAPVPPPPGQAPGGGTEDALACTPGATGSTTFQLADLPNHRRPAPLAIGGDQRFAGSHLTSVTVTTWNGADRLRLRHGPDSVVLTPASPTATLPAGVYPLGGNEWTPSRTAGDGATWQNPVVQLGHSCPATPATPVPVVQGYALSLQALDGAISAATGGTGLASIVTSGTADTWPVYAARITPTGTPPGAGPTHSLLLELVGTHGAMTLPLVQTGAGSWSLDVERTGYTLHGTVTTGPSGLTLSLASGTVGEGSEPLSLLPTTLTLPPTPTNTANP